MTGELPCRYQSDSEVREGSKGEERAQVTLHAGASYTGEEGQTGTQPRTQQRVLGKKEKKQSQNVRDVGECK